MAEFPDVEGKVAEYAADRVEERRRELGVEPTELVEEAGYANLNKGRRRLEALEDPGARLPDRAVVRTFVEALEWEWSSFEREIDGVAAQVYETRREDTILAKALYRRRKRRTMTRGDVRATIDDSAASIAALERVETRFPTFEKLAPVAETLGFEHDRARDLLENEYRHYDRYLETPELFRVIRRPAACYSRVEKLGGATTREIVERTHRLAESLEDVAEQIALASLNSRRQLKVAPDGRRWEDPWRPRSGLGPDSNFWFGK